MTLVFKSVTFVLIYDRRHLSAPCDLLKAPRKVHGCVHGACYNFDGSKILVRIFIRIFVHLYVDWVKKIIVLYCIVLYCIVLY